MHYGMAPGCDVDQRHSHGCNSEWLLSTSHQGLSFLSAYVYAFVSFMHPMYECPLTTSTLQQGPDYEKFAKYKKTDKFAEMLGLRPEPKKNMLGAPQCVFISVHGLYVRVCATSLRPSFPLGLNWTRYGDVLHSL
jgi:hypothetical protein